MCFWNRWVHSFPLIRQHIPCERQVDSIILKHCWRVGSDTPSSKRIAWDSARSCALCWVLIFIISLYDSCMMNQLVINKFLLESGDAYIMHIYELLLSRCYCLLHTLFLGTRCDVLGICVVWTVHCILFFMYIMISASAVRRDIYRLAYIPH